MTAESYTDLLKPIKNFRIFEYNVTKLNEEAAESLNRPITADKIEAVIKKLLAHRSPGHGFTGEFYKAFKEELPLSFIDYSKKSKKMEDSQTLFMKPESS